jgi:hypothetical protein
MIQMKMMKKKNNREQHIINNSNSAKHHHINKTIFPKTRDPNNNRIHQTNNKELLIKIDKILNRIHSLLIHSQIYQVSI